VPVAVVLGLRGDAQPASVFDQQDIPRLDKSTLPLKFMFELPLFGVLSGGWATSSPLLVGIRKCVPANPVMLHPQITTMKLMQSSFGMGIWRAEISGIRNRNNDVFRAGCSFNVIRVVVQRSGTTFKYMNHGYRILQNSEDSPSMLY
jgi:hypothetical protein